MKFRGYLELGFCPTSLGKEKLENIVTSHTRRLEAWLKLETLSWLMQASEMQDIQDMAYTNNFILCPTNSQGWWAQVKLKTFTIETLWLTTCSALSFKITERDLTWCSWKEHTKAGPNYVPYMPVLNHTFVSLVPVE